MTKAVSWLKAIIPSRTMDIIVVSWFILGLVLMAARWHGIRPKTDGHA